MKELKRQENKFNELRKKIQECNEYQKTLLVDESVIDEIKKFDKKWDTRNKLWKNVNEFNKDSEGWFNDPFEE